MRRSSCTLLISSVLAASGAAPADDAPRAPPADPGPGADPGSGTDPGPGPVAVADLAPDPDAAADPAAIPDAPIAVTAPRPAEVIEVTGSPPAAAGAIAVDARVARRTAGALGEPFRVLALLPGVTTSVAASGYPVIRGTLPGESRFLFDGIELPMLYHLLLGTEVIHPSFIGELQLRAGGYGADQGHMLGGLITMTPASADQPRTELRINLVELGAFRAQPLSAATSIAVAARVGTLDGAAKIYDSAATLHYVDQQTRLVHRFGNDDVLTLTSLGAYDYVKLPPDPGVETLALGYHRLDARWSRGAPGRQLRAGVQSELDSMRGELEYRMPADQLIGILPPPRKRGSQSYGARAYADGELRLAPWIAARGGVEARHRVLDNREPLFAIGRGGDPTLAPANAIDSEGVWTSIDLRLGPLLITPGIRADSYQAELAATKVRHADLDPRLAVATELPAGGQLELSGGVYSAPPQVSVIERSIVLGPLPTTEGTGISAGISRGYQAQASVRTPLGAGLVGNFAAYYRDTDYAIDFGMLDKPFSTRTACAPSFPSGQTSVYRHIGVRAMGLEAMVRRELGRSVTGWVSYSLGKVDRNLGFVQLPHDYDQRHTLNATAQWQHGNWRLGASGNLHTGRPAIYPTWVACSEPDAPPIDVISDPTHLRRLPASWRLDLRAERAFQLGGRAMRLSLELQNASLTREVTDYGLAYTDPSDPSSYRVTETSLFLPLPMLGLEVDL